MGLISYQITQIWAKEKATGAADGFISF